jgi:type I restriction enzyme S subunit
MCKSIVGMANINAKEFQKIRIPLPPIALQEDFQEIILSINSKMRDIEVNKKEYKNLFNSLMQRAFKGELDLKDVA